MNQLDCHWVGNMVIDSCKCLCPSITFPSPCRGWGRLTPSNDYLRHSSFSVCMYVCMRYKLWDRRGWKPQFGLMNINLFSYNRASLEKLSVSFIILSLYTEAPCHNVQAHEMGTLSLKNVSFFSVGPLNNEKASSVFRTANYSCFRCNRFTGGGKACPETEMQKESRSNAFIRLFFTSLDLIWKFHFI